jgi:hypothetical protein
VRTCYQIQSHRAPRQLDRLVRALLATSEDPVVVVNHDTAGEPLPTDAWADDPRVLVQRMPGGYADWSHVARYLAVTDLLAARGVDYDWMVNLSGQDYPLRSLRDAEKELAESGADGFVHYFRVLGPESRWPAHRGRDRYWFRYRQLGRLTERTRWRLRPLQAVNRVQPLIRVHTATSFSLGRRTHVPYGPDFVCYGGSAWYSLSRDCVEYLRSFTATRRDVVEHYRGTLAPEESLFHTALLNAGRFRLVNDNRRYVDFRETRLGHPRTLELSDVAPARASGAHFARKWDLGRTPEAFDELDALVYAS